MKKERRQPTQAELEQITSRCAIVVRRIPHSPRPLISSGVSKSRSGQHEKGGIACDTHPWTKRTPMDEALVFRTSSEC